MLWNLHFRCWMVQRLLVIHVTKICVFFATCWAVFMRCKTVLWLRCSQFESYVLPAGFLEGYVIFSSYMHATKLCISHYCLAGASLTINSENENVIFMRCRIDSLMTGMRTPCNSCWFSWRLQYFIITHAAKFLISHHCLCGSIPSSIESG